MEYSISEVSKIINLPISTIRYYDKEGLLPFITRKDSGYRVFSENEVKMLQLIECLKKTGMPIKDIKTFSEWIKAGDNSLQERYDMFMERKAIMEAQIEELQTSLNLINHKCEYYKKSN